MKKAGASSFGSTLLWSTNNTQSFNRSKTALTRSALTHLMVLFDDQIIGLLFLQFVVTV
jgi:hypothetical protein